MTPRRTSALGAAVLLMASGAACAEPDRRPDVLLVTIDTLRADHVSAYGHPYARTPVIDALAGEGALFERHHAVTGLTGPAHVTLFSGLHPRQHGARRNGVAVPTTLTLLAERFERAGWRTGAAIGAAVLGSELGFGRGFGSFDERFDPADESRAARERGAAYERPADDVVDAALAFLEGAEGGTPQLLWVHLFDPHLPHVRPVEEWPLVRALVEAGCVLAEPNDFQDEAHVARLRRGYTAEVRYTDAELGRLLAAWDARPSEREDVVLVTADHGEGLGEHAYIGHSFYLYQEQLRIPLVVRMPRRIAPGTRVPAVTSSVDVAATILDLAGLEAPREVGGRSLLALLGKDPSSGSPAYAERPALADAMSRLRRGEERDPNPRTLQGRLIAARSGAAGSGELGLIAVVHDDRKYVWSEDAPDESYDLRADPRELDDLGEGHPSTEALLPLVLSWAAAVVPLHEAPRRGDDGGTRDMLDALGY